MASSDIFLFTIGALLLLCIGLLVLYLQASLRLKKKVERDTTEQLFLDAIINDTVDSIYLKDTQSRIIFTNKIMRHNIGKKAEEVYGFTDKEIFSEEFGIRTMAQEADIMKTGIPLISLIEVEHIEEDVYNNVLTTKVPVHKNGEVVGTLGITREYNEIAREYAELAHSATHDSLTNILNRNYILNSIREALAANQPIAILFVDMDNFKQVNDQYGHDIGDEVLAKLSQRMKSAIRKIDRVGRYGGDEFVIILTGITDHTEAETAVKHLLHQLQQPVDVKEHQISCSISIGIVCCGDFPSMKKISAERLIHCADQAMYMTKERGKNGYFFYQPKE